MSMMTKKSNTESADLDSVNRELVNLPSVSNSYLTSRGLSTLSSILAEFDVTAPTIGPWVTFACPKAAACDPKPEAMADITKNKAKQQIKSSSFFACRIIMDIPSSDILN